MSYLLVPVQQKAIIEILSKKLRSVTHCPECGSVKGFELLRQLFELREYSGPASKSPNFIPHAVLQCSNCGHSRLFDAVKLGIIDPATGRYKV